MSFLFMKNLSFHFKIMSFFSEKNVEKFFVKIFHFINIEMKQSSLLLYDIGVYIFCVSKSLFYFTFNPSNLKKKHTQQQTKKLLRSFNHNKGLVPRLKERQQQLYAMTLKLIMPVI